jgi:hypothetical protein
MSYFEARVTENSIGQDGEPRLVLAFSGNEGEPLISVPVPLQQINTAAGLRQFVHRKLEELNSKQTASKLAAVEVGKVIPPQAPPGPPAATPEEIWLAKVRRLQRFKELGLTAPAAAADLATLTADVNNTYSSAYVAKL